MTKVVRCIKYSFLSLILFVPMVTSSWALDITGTYKGYFQYYDKKRNDEIGNFTIDIQQLGKIIIGTVKEPRTTFGPNKPFLYADIKGRLLGNSDDFSLEFTKTYRYSGHAVSYKGKYKSFIGQVEGEWNIGNYKGFFQISGIDPVSEIDFEPPVIMLTKPSILKTSKSSRGMKRISVLKENNIKIAGLVSDNEKIDKVLVNGVQASISVPTHKEQNMIQGRTVKFSKTIALEKLSTVVIDAFDIHQNKASLKLKLEPKSKPVADPDEKEAGRKIALVIGINEYAEWPPLEFAVNDAKSVALALKNKQGFDVVMTITDKEATRNNILKLLGYKLGQIAEPEDSIIIYFAGHGHTESLQNGGKDGYIIPVDAGREDSFLSGISMRQLRSVSRRIRAKHILFVMDSCYSGLGFTRSAGLSSNEDDFIKKIKSYRVVQMITAGGANEQALELNGHGLFTKYFLDGISGQADSDNNGYVTGSELGLWLRREVTKASQLSQTPSFGRFEGEGDFVFKVVN